MKVRISTMSIGDRLRTARRALGFTQREMADRLDTPYRTYQTWEQGTSTPSYEALERLLELGFDGNWLLSGGAPDAQIKRTTPDAQTGDAGVASIPFYESPRASMGSGAIIESEASRQVSIDERMLRELAFSSKNLAMMAADGKSMEPTIRSGELLLFDMSEEARRPKDGIFIVRLEGALMVKRLQPLPGRAIRIINDNAAFEPFTVKLDDGTDFAIIARVVVIFRHV